MSTRYNTGNQIESTDMRDMSDNAKNFDEFSVSTKHTFSDRLGVTRKTIRGMNAEFDYQILNMGFARVGTFATGATLTNPRQVLLWDIADGGDGQEYGWSGTFPKIVPPSSTPSSTGGIAVGAWMSRLDPEMRGQVRKALRRSYAEAGYNLVAGSFEAGGTVTSATDVLLYEATGVAYLWLGALPKVVPPTSSPATTGGLGANDWLDIGDTSLRGDLAATGGSSLIYDAKSTVAPGSVAKFGDTAGIATLRIPDDKDQRLLLQKEATQSSDYGTMQILRRANYTSGSSGFVGSALNVKTEARGVGSGQSEWAGLFTMESRSTQSGEWPQNVGVYSQGLKYTGSSTWAGCFEISDRNPVSGGSGGAIGIEVSASANGADIAATPQRNGVHIAISRGTINSQDCEWGRGFWVTAGQAARWIYGFSAENAGSYAYHAKFTGVSADSALIRDESNCAIGLDLKRATYTTNRAIHLKMGQRIALDENATQTLRGSTAGPVLEGRLNLTGSFAVPSAGNTTSSAAAGTSGAAPSQVAGYITILIDGATKKIPFYN